MTQPFADEVEVGQLEAVVQMALEPAPSRDIARRVVSLLNHYFVSALPRGQAADVADDWLKIIGDVPAWALEDACVWWLGPENPKVDKKPLPGQIALLISKALKPVSAATIAIQRHRAGLPPLRADS